MVFEEFFKKKRIDLTALQTAEGLLFSEFKDHFEQMGEKSFDHTKKYWFNKLRRRFPLAAEIKTERVHIANPLAEQTITESLLEPVTPSPKIGFTPKFRAAAVTPTPVEKKPEETASAEVPATAESTVPKPAFKPRFNPGMVKPKPAENADTVEEKRGVNDEVVITPTETPVVKPGFKPRFNAAMVKPKPVEETETPADKPIAEAETPMPSSDTPAAKPSFKPRFNAAMMKPKPAGDDETPENKPEAKEEIPATTVADIPAAKPGFKPRFNAAMMKPKPTVEEAITPEPVVKDEVVQPLQAEEAKPAEETPVLKPAYRPKFNIKTLPKNPGQE